MISAPNHMSCSKPSEPYNISTIRKSKVSFNGFGALNIKNIIELYFCFFMLNYFFFDYSRNYDNKYQYRRYNKYYV